MQIIFKLFLLISLNVMGNITYDKKNFLTWFRADVKSFGCFLEKDFSYRDKKFNCDLKKYRNNGDPCKKTDLYYEGPQIPKDKYNMISERISSMNLAWEHGRLQEISLTLDKKYNEREVKSFFILPKSASIQECSLSNTCVILTVFDHMGGGDVECGN
jgi:hypothetical protein